METTSDESLRRTNMTLFGAMIEIRILEETINELRLSGSIPGSVHLCIGQEAIPVGACSVLDTNDPVYATYRGHGWAIARGVPAPELLAELCGRTGSTNEGRAGSAFLSSSKDRFMGENSIVGAGAPIALGSAIASRSASSPWTTIAVFGDGAMNQGSVSESLNFAAAFKLPVIFICENNVYSELTPISAMVGQDELHKRAAAFGMRAERIDGNDVATVAESVARARDRALDGGGPTFLECMTERLVGHYIGDAQHYRPRGEIEEAKKREPIVRLRTTLLDQGVEEAALDQIAEDTKQRVSEITADVLSRPPATMAHAQEHLYA